MKHPSTGCKFLLLLAVKITTVFDSLTQPERVKVMILDESIIKRNHSKTVELLARVFDHVEHKCQRGYASYSLAGQMDTHLLNIII